MTLYRKPQPAPTAEGHYYARFFDETEIEPLEVGSPIGRPGEMWAYLSGGEEPYPLSDFVWFGPVEECKEG